MLMEQDPDVAVTVRKLVIISLMELFKDITPSYKIRPLTEAEKSTKVMLDKIISEKFWRTRDGKIGSYCCYLILVLPPTQSVRHLFSCPFLKLMF